MWNIIKQFLNEDIYFYSTLIVLISVVSFGLGRMSTLELSRAQEGAVILSKQPVTAQERGVVGVSSTPTSTQLVGSKNSTKYHALWCPGASQIKEENKVYFSSEREAQANGYTKAGNCEI